MPFSVVSKKTGSTYYLHARVRTEGGKPLHFFAKEVKEGVVDALPEGYEVSESPATGLPLLKKTAS
jgi:hypothetical protein